MTCARISCPSCFSCSSRGSFGDFFAIISEKKRVRCPFSHSRHETPPTLPFMTACVTLGRQWCLKFGQTYANELCMVQPPHHPFVQPTSSPCKPPLFLDARLASSGEHGSRQSIRSLKKACSAPSHKTSLHLPALALAHPQPSLFSSQGESPWDSLRNLPSSHAGGVAMETEAELIVARAT
jgi:hypothetical protein